MPLLNQEFRDLLIQIESLNIKISVENGNIRIKAPKGSITPPLKGLLSKWKADLIDYYRLKDQVLTVHDIPERLGRESYDNLPISHAQKGVLLAEKAHPFTAIYHTPFGLDIHGHVDVACLTKAIEWAVDRHENLRTAYIEHDGRSVAVVTSCVELPFQIIDLSDVASDAIDEQVSQILTPFLYDPFDLTAAPIFRALLLQLAPEHCHLLFNFHHIIGDCGSLGDMILEIGEKYKGMRTGEPEPFVPLTLQYIDYAHWQNERFSSEGAKAASLLFWEEHLMGASEFLDLPTDRPRTTVVDPACDIVKFNVDRETKTALDMIAKHERATLFMVLLATFYVLLHRYSEKDDIVIGTRMANRSSDVFADIMGLFVNTIALRSHLNPDDTFSGYLKQIRHIVLTSLAHQDIPYELVIEQLQPEKNPMWNPLYQAMFVLQNNSTMWPDMTELSARAMHELAVADSRLDLSMDIREDGDQLIGQIEYNVHLFDVESIQQMADCYLTFLHTLVGNPEITLSELTTMEVQNREGRDIIQELPAMASYLTQSARLYAPPSDDIEIALVQIWEDLFGISRVGLYDDFFALGGQSITGVQLFSQIQKRFSVDINISQLFDTSTLFEIAEIIRDLRQASGGNRTAVSRKTPFQYLMHLGGDSSSSAIPFFCVHGAGGNTLFMRKWLSGLKNAPFFAFQARGVDGATKPHLSIEEMATAYLDEMLQVRPAGPWILGGYSGGGVIALEMALQMEARGFEKPPIIMIDTYHPKIEPRGYNMSDRIHLMATEPASYLHNLVTNRIVGRFKKASNSMQDFDTMLANGGVIPIELRNDYLSDKFDYTLQNYTSPESYGGDVFLICSKEVWPMYRHAGYERGWQDTIQKIEVVEVPGDHFTMIEEPFVDKLIECLWDGISKFSDEAQVNNM